MTRYRRRRGFLLPALFALTAASGCGDSEPETLPGATVPLPLPPPIVDDAGAEEDAAAASVRVEAYYPDTPQYYDTALEAIAEDGGSVALVQDGGAYGTIWEMAPLHRYTIRMSSPLNVTRDFPLLTGEGGTTIDMGTLIYDGK